MPSAAASSSLWRAITAWPLATARLGQPEVHLGIIPGAGGTQRLPRLCGPVLALEMCTGGQPVAAAQAEQAGIVDAVIDGDLLEGAIAFAQSACRGEGAPPYPRSARQISDRAAGIAACQAVRATVGKAARGARAPFAAVDAIEACFTMDFDAGSRREIELFADCVLSTESKAMRHVFFAEREAGKVPDVPKDTPTARSLVPPSSAPAPWGAGSPWRTRMPASRFCSRTWIRPRWTVACP